jgi:hypothetical protein
MQLHAGLLPAIGAAAADLASFLTARNALKENSGGDPSKVSLCIGSQSV